MPCPVSSRRTLNPRQRRPRGGDQPLVGAADRLDRNRRRGVAEVPVELDGDIELDQISGLDLARARDAVDRLVADADADRAREPVGDDRARSAAMRGDDLGGERIELAGADARRHGLAYLAQHARGQRTGTAQALELFG
jgi:hypothetical protein